MCSSGIVSTYYQKVHDLHQALDVGEEPPLFIDIFRWQKYEKTTTIGQLSTFKDIELSVWSWFKLSVFVYILWREPRHNLPLSWPLVY